MMLKRTRQNSAVSSENYLPFRFAWASACLLYLHHQKNKKKQHSIPKEAEEGKNEQQKKQVEDKK